MIKRILSLVLCLCMLAGSFSFSVSADGVEAVIGSTEYATLEEAVAAARNGDVIILKDNVTLDSIVKINKTLTLRSDIDAVITGGFEIAGSLTLMGVSVNGSGLSDPYCVNVTGGSFTMRKGSAVSGGIRVNGGVFNFYGGVLNAPSDIWVEDDSSTFRMAGDATFNGDISIELPDGFYIEIAAELTGNGSININIPSAASGNRIAVLTAGVSVSAAQLGRFNVSASNKAYTVILNGNEIIIDKPAGSNDVARIGEVGYSTLNEAFNAAANTASATITLTSVAVVNSPITVKGNIKLESDGNYTVFAGDSLAGSVFVISGGSTLTLSDSDNTVTVSGKSNGAALFDVQGNLKIDSSVVITGNQNTAETYNKGVVYVNGGNFSMTGGAITSNKSNTGTVYVASGSFEMSGGVINNNTASVAGGVYIAGGSFVLSGGAIYANSGDGVWNGGSFSISGSGAIYSSATYPGTVFLSNSSIIKVSSSWTPTTASEGYSNVIPIAMTEPKLYDVVAEFDGTAAADYFKMSDRYENKFALMVKEKNLIVAAADEVYTVYWGNNPYMTIGEAVADLPENIQATLKVVGDTVVSETVLIKNGMNITVTTDANPASLDEYTARTVKRSTDFTGAIFRVEKGATLMLEAAENKNLIFDGENKPVASAMLITAGGVVIGKGVEIKSNSNKSAEKLNAPSVFTFGGGVYVEKGGSCSINGGTVSGNYASYGAGIYVNDGTLSMSEGEIKENAALYGAGVYLETSGTDKTVYSTFAMAGGKVTANKAPNVATVAGSGVAGGVYITNGSSFMMSDGNIANNTAAKASGVCVGTAVYAKEIPQPKMVISDKANIASDNIVYLAIPNISFVTVTSTLTTTTATVIAIPEEMPQNMKLVVFEHGDNTNVNETAAKKALDSKRFELDKAASEYFEISVSHADKSVLVNTAGEYLPSRTKAGKHHNGLAMYVEGDEEPEEGTEPTPVVYDPVVIRENGSFTTAYEFDYYPNLYKNINSFITAPFPEETRIVMIDTSDEENIGYYYYEVNGDETVVTETEPENGKKTPDVIEIPLVNFYKMGTKDTFYTPIVNEDTSKKALISEKLLFVIDFTDVRVDDSVSFEGEFTMSWNHYYPGASEGERYDISGNVMTSQFAVSTKSSSTVTLSATEEGILQVDYELTSESVALARNKGVLLFQSGNGGFPRGTVLTDTDGNQYVVAGKSAVIAVPLPCDKDGNIKKTGKIELNLSNYYGTAIVNATMRCVIVASDDGKHFSVGAAYDAESEGVKLSLEANDEYSILVSTPDGTKKPYYESYEVLKESEFLDMTVKGLANTVEVDSFNLSILKKQDGEYLPCNLSELFKVGDDYGSEVILSTGSLSLELTTNIEALIGNEYKIAFKVGDAVEYVKVNVIKEKKK